MASLSPNIGKIAGITIQLHWTFLALMLLAFVFLVTTTEGLFLFSLIILLFVCVLIHELAHSLVSQRNHLKVKKIILLPIGGASVVDLSKVKPDVELRIAIAGPLTSIALGAIFGILWLYTPGTGLLKQGVQFLFEINILLGLFNLLPGFPLDGGRVLRSYLQRKHSFMESTQLAVKASNLVIIALIIGTIIYAALMPNATFITREFVIFWDVIIALFLYDGAKAELQAAIVKEYTDKMSAAGMASSNYIVVKPGTSTDYLYKMMLDKGTRVVLLKRGRKLMKASERQLAKMMESQHTVTSKSTPYFTTEIPQVRHNERLSEAVERMRNEEIDTIAVMKNGRLSGVIYAPYIEAALQMHLARTQKGKESAHPVNQK